MCKSMNASHRTIFDTLVSVELLSFPRFSSPAKAQKLHSIKTLRSSEVSPVRARQVPPNLHTHMATTSALRTSSSLVKSRDRSSSRPTQRDADQPPKSAAASALRASHSSQIGEKADAPTGAATVAAPTASAAPSSTSAVDTTASACSTVLRGCVVAFVGRFSTPAMKLKQRVEMLGGTAAFSINSSLTHCIATKEEADKRSSKITQALRHHAVIVSEVRIVCSSM